MEQPEEKAVTTRPRNVFTYKSYTLAFLGALVSNLGNIFYSFSVSYYILGLTDNNAFIQGAYLATGGIVFVLVTLFGGVLGDRFHKGRIMYICDYAKGAMLIGFTLLLMFVFKDPTSQVVVLFIIAVFSNAIAGIFSPAASSLLPQIVPEESFQQAQSYNSVMQSGLSIIGIILAGILYSFVPIHVLFLIVGGCYVLSGVSEMFIKYDYKAPEEKLTIKSAFADLKSGFKYIVAAKPIFYLMLSILFINFFFAPITSNFLPYFIAADVAGSAYWFSDTLSPQMWGSIISVAMGVGMIVTGLILSARPKKPSIAKGLRIAFLALDVLLIALTICYLVFTKGHMDINAILMVILVGSLSIGLLLPTINIPTSTTLITLVDKDKLGKVSSILDIGSQGLIPLSNLLAGSIISGIGAPYLLIICAAGFVLVTIFILINKHIAKL